MTCTWSSLKLALSKIRYQLYAGSLRGSLYGTSIRVGQPSDGRQSLGTAAFVGGGSIEASTDGDSKALVDLEYTGKNKILKLEFKDGVRFSLPAEFLRIQSPAATSSKTVVHGRRHVGILDIEPVGRYAVKIRFDDLHSSGLYTYDYLRQLGEKKLDMMKRYIRELRAAGLSRDPLKNITRKERRGTRNLSS